METYLIEPTDWVRKTKGLARLFGQTAALNDENGRFVYENYTALKASDYFSLLIPQELGGAGLSYAEVCNAIRIIGNQCGSTALALSMHQHLVAANVWKYKNKGEAVAMLTKVAGNQLVLVSTGARDWLESNGEVRRVEGGYKVSAKKAFASQSAVGDVLVTSAPYQNESGEWKVLHFGVPFKSEGVSLLNDWKVLGMRGTGSQTVVLKDVFVPDSAIQLERPRGEFHPVWNVVISVAMPLIMSAYVGIAERAREIALEASKNDKRKQAHIPYLLGKINNSFLAAQVQWEAMYTRTQDLEFKPSKDLSSDILGLKTNVSDACRQTVQYAVELLGGRSFYAKNELERLFRDVQASQFHPLPQWNQYEFTAGHLT
ncbi:MAG: acyl-CoA dehydrogenase family protein [Bacteroidota bacterium]